MLFINVCSQGYVRCSRILQLRQDWRRAAQMLDLAIPLSKPDKRSNLEHLLSSLHAKIAITTPITKDPVTVLPDEIWRNIMLFGLEENDDFPLAVSHVSKKWRAATVAETAAWSRLKIGERRPYGTKALQKLEAWTKRSGGNIDSIDIYLNFDDDDRQTTEAAAILRMTLPRLKVLRLHGRPGASMNIVMAAWKGQLRDVQELSLEQNINWNPYKNISLPGHARGLLARDAKSLLRLTVTGFQLKSCPLKATQAANLQECKLTLVKDEHESDDGALAPGDDILDSASTGSDDISQSLDSSHDAAESVEIEKTGPVCQLLHYAKNLEKLSLALPDHYIPRNALDDDHEGGLLPARRLHLPRLKIFEETRFRYSLLSQMRVPALESISLRAGRSYIDSPPQVLMARGSIEFEKIKHLDLEASDLDTEKFCALLDRLPSLESFKFIAADSMTSEVVEHLAQHPDRWTSFQSLDVQGSGLTGGPVLRLVRSRLPAPVRPEKTASQSSLPRPFGARSSSSSLSHSGDNIKPTLPQRSPELPSGVPLAFADMQVKPEASSASPEASKTARVLQPLKHLVLRHCPNVEKAAEDWLRANIPSFQYVAPTPVPRACRDRFRQ